MSFAAPIAGLEFHHIGIACRNIEREARQWFALGYEYEGAVFEDPIQGISGQFLVGGGPRVELVAPLSEDHQILKNVLENGIKMYHFAYLTEDLDLSLTTLKSLRAKCVVDPVAAAGFKGKRIAFAFMPNMMLVELVEK